MKLYIKNMVCDRCKMVVKSRLEELGLHPVSVELGEVEIDKVLSGPDLEQVRSALRTLGFDLLDDRKSRIIQQVKNLIIDLVRTEEPDRRLNLSDYLTAHLPYTYSYISGLFADVEGITLERYHIGQKIERVKELIVYDELTLSEIAFRMGYSSVAHLSNQFKKITGLTPSHYRDVGNARRRSIDQL